MSYLQTQTPAEFEPVSTVSFGLVFNRGVDLFKKSLVPMMVASVAMAGALWLTAGMSFGFGLLGALMLTTPISVGMIQVAHRAARGEETKPLDFLRGFTNPAAYALGALTTAAMFAGLMAFVLPFFYVLLGSSMADVFVARHNQGAIQALKNSFTLFNRNLGLMLLLSGFAMALALVGNASFVLSLVAVPLALCMRVVAVELLMADSRNADLK